MANNWKWSGVDKRCVHLDFHTSELIEGIGSAFSRKEFADMLKRTIRAAKSTINRFISLSSDFNFNSV